MHTSRCLPTGFSHPWEFSCISFFTKTDSTNIKFSEVSSCSSTLTADVEHLRCFFWFSSIFECLKKLCLQFICFCYFWLSCHWYISWFLKIKIILQMGNPWALTTLFHVLCLSCWFLSLFGFRGFLQHHLVGLLEISCVHVFQSYNFLLDQNCFY